MVKTYLGASGSVATVANETSFWPLGGKITKGTGEANRATIFRSTGTITNLYVRVTANSIAGNSTVLTRKNATTDGNNTVTIGSSATGEFTDTTNSDTVAAADTWLYKFVPGAATNTMTFSLMSCIFSADTDTVTRTETTWNTNVTTASTTWFVALLGDSTTAVTTETNAKHRIRVAGTLKNGACRVTTARATASTVKSRKNAADGTISISCTAGGTGQFEDTTHSDTVSAGEDWNWSITTGTGVDTLNIASISGDFVSTNGDSLVGTSDMVTVAYPDAATGFTQISGRHTNVATEANTKADCRIAGDYKELTCLVTQNGVSSASSLVLRKNGTDTTLIASITGSTTGVFSDSTHTVTLVSTDEVNYSIVIPSVAGSQTVSITNIIMVIKAPNALVRALSTETTSISDSIARLLAATRAPSTETTSSGETLARMIAANRALSTETTTVGESLARSKGQTRALSTETVTSGESLARMLAATRNPVENTAVGETLARMIAANRALGTETTTVGDSVARVKGVVRALSTETVTIGESLARLLAATRAPATENTAVSDSIARMLAANRTLSDTVVIGESLNRMIGFNRALATETTTIGESLNRMLAANRALGTENTTIGESLNRVKGAVRVLSTETVVIGEALNRLLAANRALGTQTTSISDQLDYVYTPGGGATNYNRSLSDTVTIGESLARMLAATRVLSTEVTTISDQLNRQLAVNRTLSDTTTVGESLARLITRVRNLIENTTVGETLARRFTGTRTLSDTTTISDSLAKVFTAFVIPTQLKTIVQWLKAKYSISNPPKE